MLKDKEFWNDIEDIINDKDSDYVVLDLYFAMKTYQVLSDDDLSLLPVPDYKFRNIYHSLFSKVFNLLTLSYYEYNQELYSIAKNLPAVGTAKSVLKVFEFIKEHKEPLALFCAMGVLNAFEDYDTNDYTLIYVQSAKEVLFKVITSL